MILITLPDLAFEDTLLAGARNGSHESLRQIFDLYYDSIYQYIRLRVEDAPQAEDMASDVFVKLLDSLRKGKAPRQSLRGWLFKVARNAIYDHYGKRKRLTLIDLEEWIPSEGDEPELQFMQTLNAESLRAALRLLTDEQQEVLILRFGQMLSLQETAAIMGKHVNAIKALQFRATNALRRTLNQLRSELAHG
ncbi:MAG: sigma-70 family RNA polymerase sigma factor [Anaerolineae bacterium]|nr:sigma-70 family RNA polymerase sigma factor [Anaerolineae bacterium]MCA9909098.1 sigma-70 family RNA polymerase sigma factor [Anaerolineae bacterium]